MGCMILERIAGFFQDLKLSFWSLLGAYVWCSLMLMFILGRITSIIHPISTLSPFQTPVNSMISMVHLLQLCFNLFLSKLSVFNFQMLFSYIIY